MDSTQPRQIPKVCPTLFTHLTSFNQLNTSEVRNKQVLRLGPGVGKRGMDSSISSALSMPPRGVQGNCLAPHNLAGPGAAFSCLTSGRALGGRLLPQMRCHVSPTRGGSPRKSSSEPECPLPPGRRPQVQWKRGQAQCPLPF